MLSASKKYKEYDQNVLLITILLSNITISTRTHVVRNSAKTNLQKHLNKLQIHSITKTCYVCLRSDTFKRFGIWLSAKRCVCNGRLGCAENKSCLKKYFVMSVGWMSVKMNEDSWYNCIRNLKAVWKICLIKCDFTAEIQPRKTDSGTEPVTVGVIWLKKTRKSYIYHIYHVCKRSFYKIHESERLPLNYAFVKSISNFVWSDVICVAIRKANFPQQTENNSDPWHERKWRHMHVRLTVGQSLRSFEKI